MPSTWQEATEERPWSITNAVQAFDGNRRELIAAFAGVDTSQKGYAQTKEYKATLRNFERWQAKQTHGPLREGEKAKQSRQISPASQAKLDKIVQARQRQERPLAHLSIRGKIQVNDSDLSRRPRRIEKSMSWGMVDRLARVSREKGDTAAWQVFSEWYGGGAAYRPISVDISIQ